MPTKPEPTTTPKHLSLLAVRDTESCPQMRLDEKHTISNKHLEAKIKKKRRVQSQLHFTESFPLFNISLSGRDIYYRDYVTEDTVNSCRL
ncbi:hypothetical protein CEXT_413451 [Caerostris extrusa]|uniref:Uncharacterized protein n=1 Tax=Caerostris extrusa TaxID=172846 RepID=A0AAV4N300_CAEEX|nr:hypothetical protein CEXT_413451 [Caerostris extrusa]